MFNLRERITTQWDVAKRHLMLVLGFVGLLWAVYIIGAALPAGWDLRQWGIHPRTMSGLASIAAAPFLHVDFGHLLANTLPLAVLGWIIVMSGRGLFVRVFIVTALTSGLGAWAFGNGGFIHEGVSGVLFGMLGFLLARGWFARRVAWTLIALAVALLYIGQLLYLFNVSPGISWSSHIWGFAGGIGLAWWMYGRREPAKSS